ncbi:phosphotransferase [Rhodobacter sp. Har01]|uniref:phosphotransferase enzyme family protein n=1 Tax=Rhodobacter sp. Har01 TaxID=2883999 RepID=UPI001D060305|nr:phosphotransferase [Rhodobacter sp. Har01]MCB6177733.1 phosphotransferase [Rhodobacter sp. Har01]
MTADPAAWAAAALWGGRLLRLAAARENAVHEMRLPDGRRAALRLHRPGYQSEAAIRSELWWCAALADRGLPVPAPVAAQTGEVLVRLAEGAMASAVVWLEGAPLGEARVAFAQPLPRLLEVHQAMGQLLRQVHQVSAGLVLPEGFTRPRWDRAGLVGEAPFWGRFWDHPAATEADRAVLVAARGLLAERLRGKAETLVHADVLRENILVNDHSVSLIDFDDSGWGFALYDLGTALAQSLDEPAYGELRDALMAGYGTADTALVETMILARCCASVGWMMPRLAPGNPVVPLHITRAVDWARHVMR